MTTEKKRRIGVIGAGAAGCMAAIAAAGSGTEVLLIEGTKDGGRKILISGGGRCNVLPASVDVTRYVTDSSPNLLRKIVRAWPLPEQIAFFEKTLGIPLAEETESVKLFPASNKARDVRDGLLNHARARGVQVLLNARVRALTRTHAGWTIGRDNGEPIDVDAVVLATGGLSVPATGSDGFGLDVLAGLGHTIHPTYAALTPLTCEPAVFAALAGVSLTVTLTAKSERRSAIATGGFLFTHRGYSGPAVLDVSHVAVRSTQEPGPRATIRVRWTPLGDAEWEAALKPSGARTVSGAVRLEMPDRLASALIESARVDPLRVLTELRRDERMRVIETLVRGELPWTGDEGYKKAEVTGGGVSLAEIDPRTMESRKHPSLFICGELLDAFGPIGGYNFFWAWATGRAAGLGSAGIA
ncbi:MAG TPA: aminoacetone oxidase family FAD-binding enzyme [Gemmatimonadaceae bacterium]|nr:aminoacetone oxidase family FAD-binding enzyme [Gemmatimonadaceae bacterium]